MRYDELRGFCRQMRKDDFFENLHFDRCEKKSECKNCFFIESKSTFADYILETYLFHYVRGKIHSVKKRRTDNFQRRRIRICSERSLLQEKLEKHIVQCYSHEHFDSITKRIKEGSQFFLRNYFK